MKENLSKFLAFLVAAVFVLINIGMLSGCGIFEPSNGPDFTATDARGVILCVDKSDWNPHGNIGARVDHIMRDLPDKNYPAIAPAFPNPAKRGQTVQIPFANMGRHEVRVAAFNKKNGWVKDLYRGDRWAYERDHILEWDTAGLAPGIYVIMLRWEEETILGDVVITE